MEEPKIAAKEPAAVELEEGKKYFSVRVVNPPTNHFVMEPIQGAAFSPWLSRPKKRVKRFFVSARNLPTLHFVMELTRRFLRSSLVTS